MRFCFIGHPFHDRTKSSGFLLEILSELGEVDVRFSDPDGDGSEDDGLIEALRPLRFDAFVFFQTEHLAERLRPIVSGRFVLVPMYDGARGRPDAFWHQFVGATILSFCRAHHEHLIGLGCRSVSFRYFPPMPPLRARDVSRRDAFFWERRPDQAIDLARVVDLCRQLGVTALHVHAAPDFARHARPFEPRLRGLRGSGLSITHSSWFEDRAAFEAVARAPLFVFAPREWEGIGMGVLEAMAAGQIVVAPDRPTLNEYVGDRNTGLLYEPDRPELPPDLDEATLRRLGEAAHLKMEFGRTEWLRDVERLRSVLLDDGRRWSTQDASSAFVNRLRSAAARRAVEAGRRAAAPPAAEARPERGKPERSLS